MTAKPGPRLLGAVLAGGRSSRYGSNKALADLGGLSLVERAVRTLEPVAATVGIIANDSGVYPDEVPVRPDLVPDLGPLGGLHSALTWAGDEGLDGVVVLATDMPFVPVALVAALAGRVEARAAVVPASTGPRGLEPLCAAYHVACLEAVTAAIDRGDRAMISFFPEIRVRVLDLGVVSAFGDPDMIFFNVNRPGDRHRADAWLARGGQPERGTRSTRGSEEE